MFLGVPDCPLVSPIGRRWRLKSCNGRLHWVPVSIGREHPEHSRIHSARRISKWLNSGCDVYAFFNNDERRHAVENARDLLPFVRR